MSGQILLDVEDRLAVVTLSNPPRLGAMTRAMWRELRTVFERLHASEELRCVLLRGEGGSFCAGGDISEYSQFRFEVEGLRDFHENDVWGGLNAILECDLPVVAQIEGNCMGAGMEIASCCDIRVAGEGARFGAPIAKLGFPMAPREAQVVAREAGLATAREMLFEAAVLDAPEMKARGFLHAVVGDNDVTQQARTRCEHITRLAPRAARMNKQALRAIAQGRMDVQGAYDYAPDAEHREGIAAFLAKRKPVF